MDWILDHLQIIIAIAGAIAYWLNARNKARSDQSADHDGDGKPDAHPYGGARSMREQADTMDREDATRRIQEEIRRKIAERQAAVAAGRTPPSLSPVARGEPSPWDLEQARRREEVAAARQAEIEQADAAALERQRGLVEQLAALQARRAEADREAKAMRAQRAQREVTAAVAVAGVGEGTSWGNDGVGLLKELRNAQSLRKAILLREVLGTPVGLR